MFHRTVLALACVAGVASLLLSGCGGSSDADNGPKTYTNTEYGFALTYPGGYEQSDSKDSPVLRQMQFSTTFADPASLDEAQRHDEVVDAAVVAVSRLPQKLTDAEAQTVLDDTASQMESVSGKDLGGGYNDATVTVSPLSSLAGAPCLVTEISYSNDAGAQLHDKLYMLIKGDTYYAIQLTAAEDRWLQSSATLQGIVNSFRFL